MGYMSQPYDVLAGTSMSPKQNKPRRFNDYMKGLEESRDIAARYRVREIFADEETDLSTPEGMQAVINKLNKVDPAIAQDLRAFGLEQRKAAASYKRAEAYWLDAQSIKETRDYTRKDTDYKRSLSRNKNRYLAKNQGDSWERYVGERFSPVKADYFGYGSGGVSQEDINSVNSKESFRKLLKKYNPDIKDAEIRRRLKDFDEANVSYAEQFAQERADSEFGYTSDDGPAKDDSGENDIRKIINGDGSKKAPPETKEHKAGRQKRARDVLGLPSNFVNNLLIATDPENNVTTDKYDNARKIYSEMEDPSAPTLLEPKEGYVQKGLKNISGYGQPNERYSRPEFITQEEGMLRGVKSGPLPDQVGREAYATEGVPQVGNRTAPPGGSRMLSATGEALNFGKEDTRSMPVEEFRELAEDINKGWEKLSRQDQMQTIQFATDYAESNPDISAEQLASKFKIPLAFAQEIIRTITGIRNRKNTFLTNQ